MQETLPRKMSITKKVPLWIALACMVLYAAGSLLSLKSDAAGHGGIISKCDGLQAFSYEKNNFTNRGVCPDDIAVLSSGIGF
ncbi:MAG TPA: hypothetical protein V6C97_08510 [Oculatellaceae cyanobacterium]